MKKPTRKLTAAEKRAKAERRANYRMVFIHGKQKWVPREPMIEGLLVDEFILRNADRIWLHQEGPSHLIAVEPLSVPPTEAPSPGPSGTAWDDDHLIPF